jgi:hypothetical protein
MALGVLTILKFIFLMIICLFGLIIWRKEMNLKMIKTKNGGRETVDGGRETGDGAFMRSSWQLKNKISKKLLKK